MLIIVNATGDIKQTFILLKKHIEMVENITILGKMSIFLSFLENATSGGVKCCVDLNSVSIYSSCNTMHHNTIQQNINSYGPIQFN